jgi:dolichyl-phosphate-mannose--protein O-mannosyl transferase
MALKKSVTEEYEPLPSVSPTLPDSPKPYYWTSLIVLTVLAFLVRVFKLATPSQVVFDEVHFGIFLSFGSCQGILYLAI